MHVRVFPYDDDIVSRSAPRKTSIKVPHSHSRLPQPLNAHMTRWVLLYVVYVHMAIMLSLCHIL